MKPQLVCLLAPVLLHCSLCAAVFTPLVPVSPPRILNLPADASGGSFAVTNLFDGNLRTEYASRDEGTNTVVEMDFSRATPIAAVLHVDRNDRATVAESRLDLLDAAGKRIESIAVTHTNRPGGQTLFILPAPITAQRARWQVTRLGNRGLFSVGGAELSFFTSAPNDSIPSRDTVEVRVQPFVDHKGIQPVKVTIQHSYVEPAAADVRLANQAPQAVMLKPGANHFEWQIPQVHSSTVLPLTLQYEGQTVVRASFRQTPVRQMTVYILPHSHTDIGYTEIQTAIEAKQVKNVIDGLAAARRTATYPEGARFVWNVEVGWAADLFLERMDPEQRAAFFDAVKNGQLVLNGMYLNELTGLCRPEELVQLFRFATRISAQTGVPIDSAMISDVPGYTWGTVSAMSHAGIKYLSTAPNYFDRIGTILKEWENRPFYWVGPDGQSKVLVWIPFWGYAMSHIYREMSPKLVADFYAGLEERKYPYDIAYVRWAGHGDNAVPDPAICEFVKAWNAQYAWPKFIISGTSEAFRALEQRYAKQLPVVRGDWSPYWEDGAASSALQTAQNRDSSDRLTQAAAAFAMLRPGDYPKADFDQAWRDVLLYSEHTWGAWCSISGPERKETVEQWAIKKSYADRAEAESRDLLSRALAPQPNGTAVPGQLDVLNTLSWPRCELVTVPAALSVAGDRITDSHGNAVPSQRLVSGELVFLADVPPFSCRRYALCRAEPASPADSAHAEGTVLDNGLVRVRVDPRTGSIIELTARGIPGNLVDTAGGGGLNDYQYLIGDDPQQVQGCGPVTVSVGEKGPLVASLVVESGAPGCKRLRRELRLVAGEDSVQVVNLVDKARLEAKSYFAKDGKESLNFAFPFAVPGGELLMDLPLGAARPEQDQMPSACKNWLTVGRWTEVAGPRYGVTWVTLDAPLIEVGYLSATLLNSQTDPEVWRKRIERTQKIYSWAMNNHWGTNYRAYQDGPTVFRFILRPHRGGVDPAAATRFATGFSQPLLVTAAQGQPAPQPLLSISSQDVVVAGLKPSDDGKGLIVRLFGASGRERSVRLMWNAARPKSVYSSDTSERPGRRIRGAVSVPGYGLITLRVEP